MGYAGLINQFNTILRVLELSKTRLKIIPTGRQLEKQPNIPIYTRKYKMMMLRRSCNKCRWEEIRFRIRKNLYFNFFEILQEVFY